MRPDRIAVWGVSVLGIGLVALALVQVGGPQAGRMEARDAARFDDLLALTSVVTCKATTEGNVLPEDLSASTSCYYDARREDPYTGAPYRYEVVDREEYRLCADFEDAARLSRRAGSFDPETGCLYQQISLDPAQ
ncbi:hypothetical protein FIU97_14205 [Roseivivax sp. THAF40]|uniref:hypothetical protein n=1 Tax=unclassified Roseivivax TaxID=2639302 RepID=UPI001268EAD9|nr:MULTISPECIES: hypothetical protein [unclassified Roseivivax]QFS83898.1 hypothetical protein FIV09_13765 [Roseivivax sp. THAF197b]QFT47730.1 hypothetical protein FIU97_14205 [Roseivivax sp. THAF40]